MPGGVPGGVKGEQGGEYRPVKSGKMDGSKRWLEFTRRPSPAEAGAGGRTTGVTGAARGVTGDANRKVKEEGIERRSGLESAQGPAGTTLLRVTSQVPAPAYGWYWDRAPVQKQSEQGRQSTE